MTHLRFIASLYRFYNDNILAQAHQYILQMTLHLVYTSSVCSRFYTPGLVPFQCVVLKKTLDGSKRPLNYLKT